MQMGKVCCVKCKKQPCFTYVVAMFTLCSITLFRLSQAMMNISLSNQLLGIIECPHAKISELPGFKGFNRASSSPAFNVGSMCMACRVY